MSLIWKALLWGAVLAPLFGQAPPLVGILSSELDRNFAVLKQKGDPAPYYLGYSVTEEELWTFSATLGALRNDHHARARVLDVSLRVGSPRLDNYHRVQGEHPRFAGRVPISVDDLPGAIQPILWRETDRVYRAASERLTRIRTNQQIKVAEEDDSADFSSEPAATYFALPDKLEVPAAEWSNKLRRWSQYFAPRLGIVTSQVSLTASRQTRYLVTSEGTRLAHGRRFLRLIVSAQAKAADGMDLASAETFEFENPAALPGDDAVRAAVEKVATQLAALVRAPVVEPFVGPAILSGRASAVLFHEIFGHRIEGHRQKDESEGQTFTKSVNTRILPEFLGITFDPTRRQYLNTDLNGWYPYDDEGVHAQPVKIVENGVLKTFLMSRSPIKGFPTSNGHGRRQPGLEVVARQSNLFVESSQSVSEAALRQKLIEEIKRQNKPYGLYFDQVTGGFTMTGRRGVQAFQVTPVVVYRVYPDGRPDELVRGVEIVGTPLASFSRILATSDQPGIFNGYCGAESGSVPVAAISPAILVSEIEIEKKEKSQERPPLLPVPSEGGDR